MILLAPLCNPAKHVDLALVGLDPQAQACHYGICALLDDHAEDCKTHDEAKVLAARLHWKLRRQRELARGSTPCTPSSA